MDEAAPGELPQKRGFERLGAHDVLDLAGGIASWRGGDNPFIIYGADSTGWQRPIGSACRSYRPCPRGRDWSAAPAVPFIPRHSRCPPPLSLARTAIRHDPSTRRADSLRRVTLRPPA